MGSQLASPGAGPIVASSSSPSTAVLRRSAARLSDLRRAAQAGQFWATRERPGRNQALVRISAPIRGTRRPPVQAILRVRSVSRRAQPDQTPRIACLSTGLDCAARLDTTRLMLKLSQHQSSQHGSKSLPVLNSPSIDTSSLLWLSYQELSRHNNIFTDSTFVLHVHFAQIRGRCPLTGAPQGAQWQYSLFVDTSLVLDVIFVESPLSLSRPVLQLALISGQPGRYNLTHDCGVTACCTRKLHRGRACTRTSSSNS